MCENRRPKVSIVNTNLTEVRMCTVYAYAYYHIKFYMRFSFSPWYLGEDFFLTPSLSTMMTTLLR